VPIAFRFSKKFSEEFGEDQADELVRFVNQVEVSHRSELHEANERN
jgi:hypothetical protein